MADELHARRTEIWPVRCGSSSQPYLKVGTARSLCSLWEDGTIDTLLLVENSDKVNRVVLFAPSPPDDDAEVVGETDQGAPIRLQDRDRLVNGRWAGDVRCEGQLDTAVHDPLWNEIMAWDRVGAGWGKGGVMRSPSRTRASLPTSMLQDVNAPLFVMTAEFDRPDERRTFFEKVGSDQKVLVQAACGSHFLPYEKPRSVLHEASLEWLRDKTFQGQSSGEFNVDADLNILPAE